MSSGIIASGAVVSGGGPAGITFNDKFVEDSIDTLLDAHDPTNGGGVGDSWTEVYHTENFGVQQMQADAGLDIANRSDANAENGSGCLYVANIVAGNYPSANYSVTCDIVETEVGDDECILVLRYQDIDNMYAVEFTGSSGQIHKKVSGTWSTLGASFAGVADGSNVEFKIDGSDISFSDDGDLLRTVSDSSHTAAGKAGLGMGNVVESDADYDNQQYDNFIITDLG